MVLQVHDDLLFDPNKDELDELAPVIKNLMETALHLNVPFIVNVETGNEFITIRELLQMIGTEVFREGFYGPIWAEAPFLKQHTVPFLSQDG